MIRISFTATFVKQAKKLHGDLLEEVWEKIGSLKDKRNHKTLKVHKLHGQLSKCWSFYVNYKVRIVFEYTGKDEITCDSIGDHDVYR